MLKLNLFNKILLKYGKDFPTLLTKRRISLGLIGAPTSVGQPRPGVELGPNAIRSAGLIQQIQYLGHDIIDFGDFNSNLSNQLNQNLTSNKLKNELLVRQMCSKLSDLVLKVVENNRIPITLGGDHSTAIASISGNARGRPNEDICVVWVDAHADINTVETTNTGNFHGMPVSFLIREVQKIFNNPNNNCLSIKPCISAKNMAFIGLRDVEMCEMDIIRKSKITCFSTQDIDKLGIHEVIARTLDQINPKLKNKIHVSFDVDAIDEMVAPSTGTPVPAGLTLREGLCIGEEIFATNMLCGLDFVEVNPSIGGHNDVKNTIDCALNIILSFLGKNRFNLFAKSSKFDLLK